MRSWPIAGFSARRTENAQGPADGERAGYAPTRFLREPASTLSCRPTNQNRSTNTRYGLLTPRRPEANELLEHGSPRP